MTPHAQEIARQIAERLIEELELDGEPPADVTITGSQLCDIVYCLRALTDARRAVWEEAAKEADQWATMNSRHGQVTQRSAAYMAFAVRLRRLAAAEGEQE